MSPEWELLETLVELGGHPLYEAWVTFDLNADFSRFDRAQRSLTIQILSGDIDLLRGPDLDTALPVPHWEVRWILADPTHWQLSEEPGLWLRATDQGVASMWPDSW